MKGDTKGVEGEMEGVEGDVKGALEKRVFGELLPKLIVRTLKPARKGLSER